MLYFSHMYICIAQLLFECATLRSTWDDLLGSEITAFVNMANQKLKLNSLTRDVLVESTQIVNVLADQDLTLNKLRDLNIFF